MESVPGSPRETQRPTLQSDLVPLQTLHGLLEQLISTGGLSRDIVLLPLNGDFDSVKDLLDRVGDLLSDTISWDEGDGVFACIYSKLRRMTNTSALRTSEFRWQLGKRVSESGMPRQFPNSL